MPPTPVRRNLPSEFSSEFQTKILAISVREPYFLRLYSDIFQPALFDSVYHRDLCLWIGTFFATYRLAPSRPILTRLLHEYLPPSSTGLINNYISLIDQIFRVGINEAPYIVDQLVRLTQYQARKAALVQMTDLLETGDFDGMDRVYDSAKNIGQGVGDLGLTLTDSWHAAVRDFGNLNTGLSTRFRRLQMAIGGYLPGEETVVIAPAGAGKTAFMGNLALGASLFDTTVFYYTLEIKAARMLCRFYANLAGLRTRELTAGAEQVHRAIQRYQLTTTGNVYVKFMPARFTTVHTLRSHLSMAAAQGIHPGLVVIDYADLLRGEMPYQTRDVKTHEVLRNTYEELRLLGDEFQTHIMTGSQSTRHTLYASVIDLDDFAESWGKAQTADSVIAICQMWEEQQAGVGRLFIAKARNEMRGSVVHFVSNYEILRLREVDQANYIRVLRARGYQVTDNGEVMTSRGRRARAFDPNQRSYLPPDVHSHYAN